jgi:3-deoxy-D-manno-octulosonic-acid transferase
VRTAYTVLLYALMPFVLLRLVWRGWRNRGYWQRWGERFGYFHAPELNRSIWVHAVSVGEVQAAVPLVRALRDRYPERSLVVTTTTPTGSARVRANFGDDVFHVHLPYDLPGAVHRFLDKVRPNVALIMETELWPNLFAGCATRQIPVVVANARLSARSAQGYQRVGRLVRETLQAVHTIAAQGPGDAQRFISIGASREQVALVGNLKFELQVPPELEEEARHLRAQWGSRRAVWVAASTHEGEDELILDAHARIREASPGALLVLVPRHPERFDRVADLCTRRGFACVRRSRDQQVDERTAVYLGDTLGDLLLLYAASDIAFVAGSLVPVGGHNMLEAAVFAKPIVTGPQLFNFAEISAALRDADAMSVIHDSAELTDIILELLRDSDKSQAMGRAAKQLVEDNRGTLERLMITVDSILERTST